MVTQHAQAAMLRFNNLWPEMNLYHLVVSIVYRLSFYTVTQYWKWLRFFVFCLRNSFNWKTRYVFILELVWEFLHEILWETCPIAMHTVFVMWFQFFRIGFTHTRICSQLNASIVVKYWTMDCLLRPEGSTRRQTLLNITHSAPHLLRGDHKSVCHPLFFHILSSQGLIKSDSFGRYWAAPLAWW